MRHTLVPLSELTTSSGADANSRYIINFPTKRHWKGKSRIEDIEAGLKDLVREIGDRNIRSIAIPPLGTSLGGLNWADVHPRIEAALRELDGVAVMLFEPGSGPIDDLPNRSTNVPKMTRGRAALVALMYRTPLPQTGLELLATVHWVAVEHPS